jgi:hypothetical protein
MDKPQFQHDCDHCVFLGRFVDEEQDPPGNADLYLDYEGSSSLVTVVARRGDEGSDYISGVEFQRIPAIREGTVRGLKLALDLYHQQHVVWTKTPPTVDGVYWATVGNSRPRLVRVEYVGSVGEADEFGNECEEPLCYYRWWSTKPVVVPEGPKTT